VLEVPEVVKLHKCSWYNFPAAVGASLAASCWCQIGVNTAAVGLHDMGPCAGLLDRRATVGQRFDRPAFFLVICRHVWRKAKIARCTLEQQEQNGPLISTSCTKRRLGPAPLLAIWSNRLVRPNAKCSRDRWTIMGLCKNARPGPCLSPCFQFAAFLRLSFHHTQRDSTHEI
jgi:hypothetical protein